jgi:hypothetical protein
LTGCCWNTVVYSHRSRLVLYIAQPCWRGSGLINPGLSMHASVVVELRLLLLLVLVLVLLLVLELELELVRVLVLVLVAGVVVVVLSTTRGPPQSQQ